MPAEQLHQQCAQTLARFYHYLDTSNYDALRELLAADTAWHRKGTALQGPDAIVAALQERDPARQTSHQISNLYVTLAEDGTTAQAHCYVSVYDNQGPDGSLQLKTIMLGKDGFTLRGNQWVLTEKRAGKLL